MCNKTWLLQRAVVSVPKRFGETGLLFDYPCVVVYVVALSKILPAEAHVRPERTDGVERLVRSQVVSAQIAEVAIRCEVTDADLERNFDLCFEALYSGSAYVLSLIDINGTWRRKSNAGEPGSQKVSEIIVEVSCRSFDARGAHFDARIEVDSRFRFEPRVSDKKSLGRSRICKEALRNVRRPKRPTEAGGQIHKLGKRIKSSDISSEGVVGNIQAVTEARKTQPLDLRGCKARIKSKIRRRL